MLSYLNIVENIDIKEVTAMQISGYSSAAMLAYRSSGMKQKAGTVKQIRQRRQKKSPKLMRWQRSSRKSMRNWLKLIK